MQYLCLKQLTAGKTTYYPGDMLPDDVILPERSNKLIKSGYLSKIEKKAGKQVENQNGLFTQEQVDTMITEAIAPMEQKQEELQQVVAELGKDNIVPISVKKSDGDNEQVTMISVTSDEIQRVFSIMQQSVDEGSKAITTIQSEPVLILLHAADSRKTIKEAAKKQADNLFSKDKSTNEPIEGNTATNTEGVDI